MGYTTAKILTNLFAKAKTFNSHALLAVIAVPEHLWVWSENFTYSPLTPSLTKPGSAPESGPLFFQSRFHIKFYYTERSTGTTVNIHNKLLFQYIKSTTFFVSCNGEWHIYWKLETTRSGTLPYKGSCTRDSVTGASQPATQEIANWKHDSGSIYLELMPGVGRRTSITVQDIWSCFRTFHVQYRVTKSTECERLWGKFSHWYSYL